MLKILLILFLLLIPTKQGCLEMDVILVVDKSGSVKGFENTIADALQNFVDRFQLSETGVRIGIIVFNDHTFDVVSLTHKGDYLNNGISRIRQTLGIGGTNMTEALYWASYKLMEDGRPNVKKTIVLISDGDPNFKTGAITASSQIRLSGILLCGVFITGIYSGNGYVFMRDACNPECYVETNYKLLPEILKKLDICL